MIRLLRVEIGRAWSRRLVRGMLALMLVPMIISVVAAFATHEKPTPEQLEMLLRQDAYNRCVDDLFRDRLSHGEGLREFDQSQFEERCGPSPLGYLSVGDQPDPYQLAGFKQPFLLESDAEGFAFGFAPVLLALALLFGASFVGAEWASRGFTNILVWEPRRFRVFIAKGAGIGAVAFASIVSFLAVLELLLWPVALLRGSTAGFDLASLALIVLRVGATGAVIAMLGAAISSVARATAASFVGAFVLLAFLTPMITEWKPGIGKWLITSNAIAFLAWEPFEDFSQSEPWQSGLLLAAYAAAAVAAAGAVFRRQEIG